jgi:hypothetical protein
MDGYHNSDRGQFIARKRTRGFSLRGDHSRVRGASENGGINDVVVDQDRKRDPKDDLSHQPASAKVR